MAGEGRDVVGPRGRQRPIFLPPPSDRSGIFLLNTPKIFYIMGWREYLTKEEEDVVNW